MQAVRWAVKVENLKKISCTQLSYLMFVIHIENILEEREVKMTNNILLHIPQSKH